MATGAAAKPIRSITDQNAQYPLDSGITEDPVNKAIRTRYATGGNLQIVPADPAGIESMPTEFYVATKRMAADSQGEALAKGWRYRKSGPAPQSFAVALYPYSGPDAPSVSVAPFAILDANSHEVTALALKVRDVTDYVFVSRTGPRKMVAPSAKLTVEAEVAVVRTKGDHIESVRGDSQQINPRPKSAP